MILDAGPLISVERNRRKLAALVAVAVEAGETLRTTEAIVAQVWRGANQANLAHALNAVEVRDGFGDGRRVGELLAKTGTDDPIDAHLVILGRVRNEAVLTSDPTDLEKLGDHTATRIITWKT